MRFRAGIVILASGVVACAAPSTGVLPSHLSESGETSAAREHDQTAGVLERQGRSHADATVCAGRGDGAVCYETERPYTDRELRAMQQRHEAAEHRRVLLSLRRVEEKACQGVPDADREESPFAYRHIITSVQVLPDGARFAFRPLPGVTVSRLQHVIDCHLARNGALGHDVPEMSDCPLVPRGAVAKVSAWGDGFMVEVRSPDAAGAQEIVRRAEALSP